MKDKWVMEIEYGSEYQKKFLRDTFDAMCKGIQDHAHNSHKKNKVKWERIRPEEEDELFDECVRLVVAGGRASISLLMRRMGIGYIRAALIIDEMEEQGIIGLANGAEPREVMKRNKHWQELEETLDRYFPKEECSERSGALMLFQKAIEILDRDG